MKLLDLLEGWNDPPEYVDRSGVSFLDPDYNDVKITFDYIGYDKNSGIFIVKHNETGKRYISHTDYIDSSMYEADIYEVYDRDEDGGYYYDEIDEDNARLTESSMVLFATVSYNDGLIGQNFDDWESGSSLVELDKNTLRSFYVNDKKAYNNLIKFIQEITLKEKRKR
jgi:hypothetical protein